MSNLATMAAAYEDLDAALRVLAANGVDRVEAKTLVDETHDAIRAEAIAKTFGNPS